MTERGRLSDEEGKRGREIGQRRAEQSARDPNYLNGRREGFEWARINSQINSDVGYGRLELLCTCASGDHPLVEQYLVAWGVLPKAALATESTDEADAHRWARIRGFWEGANEVWQEVRSK
jgi:hypothetical protein